MTLIDIKHLQDDLAELRAELIASFVRNKELEAMNELLRAKLMVTENQHANSLSLTEKKRIITKRGQET